jgi:hypothetical protein
MSFFWSQEAIGLLHRFYVREGLSAAQTAAAIARAVDGKPTRNAVLGKAQRMGWTKPAVERLAVEARPAGFGRVRHGPVRWPRPLPDVALPPLREVQVEGAPKLWTERLRGECAYPIGDSKAPGMQMCCGAPTGGATYCRPHRGLMVASACALTPDDQAAVLAVARRAA